MGLTCSLEVAKEKLKESTVEFDESLKRSTDAQAHFEDVRQRRRDLFLKAFAHIEKQIDGIYKARSCSSV